MVELLSPAGNMESLKAAVSAGCDAVYFGATTLNARASGQNFSVDEIASAADYCRLYRVKSYLTLNTVVSDQEIHKALPLLEKINQAGIDAVIVQDPGFAEVIRTCAPALPIHASTQMTIHNLKGVEEAAKHGFSRVVVSRELSQNDLSELCSRSPVEIEAFIHGALCMSYSGQCYFSSVIGGRSGNRGKCAQPCRQCYQKGYELSLKDLSVAAQFTDFIKTGVYSLKIEGRLKSPEYVYGVTSVYRKLIDENRNATSQELEHLARLFSRQGFTNAYFQANPSSKMFGIRTKADKDLTNSYQAPVREEPKLPVSFLYHIRAGKPMALTLSCNGTQISVSGISPETARTRETTIQEVEKQLKKTGGTPFYVQKIKGYLDSGLMVPISSLNALRRDGLTQLKQALIQTVKRPFISLPAKVTPQPPQPLSPIYQFQHAWQVEGIGSLANQASRIWLPLDEIEHNYFGKTGAVLPTIIFDREVSQLKPLFEKMKKLGIEDFLCQTYGQTRLCQEFGFVPHAASSYNLFNSYSLDYVKKAGCADATVSWECSLPQIRDMYKPLPVNAVVYGRLPLMTTQNCIIKNAGDCAHFHSHYLLRDKTGAAFPVICSFGHRNQILNAHPIYLGDKLDDFLDIGLSGLVFYFTTETVDEMKYILESYQYRRPSNQKFTRGLYYKKI